MKFGSKKIWGMVICALLCSTIPAMAKKNDKGSSRIKISKEILLDKIKGGWAGQVIGCTYGGPTEFRYNGRMIEDNVEIPWGEKEYIKRTMTNTPGLYDDVYMDLTFVECFERLGIDAPYRFVGHGIRFGEISAMARQPSW